VIAIAGLFSCVAIYGHEPVACRLRLFGVQQEGWN